MIRVILDTKVFELIDAFPLIQNKVFTLVKDEKIVILVPNPVIQELERSELKGIPNWFPVQKVTDTYLVDNSQRQLGTNNKSQNSRPSGESEPPINFNVLDFDILATNNPSYKTELKGSSQLRKVFGFEELKYFLDEGVQ